MAVKSTQESSPIIQVRKLSTRFGKQVIHKNLDLDIYKGEILGIVGESGSGKSLLLRFLMGLDPPQSGKLQYFTTPLSPSTQVGVLFQAGALISSLTVLENLLIPLTEVVHLSPELAQVLALMKIHRVGLTSLDALKYPSQLSGGMIKRAGIARALALDPEILFLDEPTAGLDPIAAADLDALIHDLRGITIVMVTHDLDTIQTLCDRVAVLVDHSLIIGSVLEISRSDHPWIQEYFHGKRGRRTFKNK